MSVEVRFKRPGRESRWRQGKLANWVVVMLHSLPDSLGPESSVDVYETRTGGVCVVNRKFVQRRARGPRGGTKWVPL